VRFQRIRPFIPVNQVRLSSRGGQELPELADENRVLARMGVDNQYPLVHLGSSPSQQISTGSCSTSLCSAE
jgi:hypothetical protein